MKRIFTPALLLIASVGFLALQSCQKDKAIQQAPAGITSAPTKAASGVISGGNITGGGSSTGGGHNGGGGGGNVPLPPAPTDTTTSLLPVAQIITVGKWKVSYFVQGNDNLTSDFSRYVFTFNSDGTMIADDKGKQTTGIWHYQEAIFYYGVPLYGSSPYGFTMSIGTQLPLISLNENYFISKKTLTDIFIDSINPNENAHVMLSKL